MREKFLNKRILVALRLLTPSLFQSTPTGVEVKRRSAKKWSNQVKIYRVLLLHDTN